MSGAFKQHPFAGHNVGGFVKARAAGKCPFCEIRRLKSEIRNLESRLGTWKTRRQLVGNEKLLDDFFSGRSNRLPLSPG